MVNYLKTAHIDYEKAFYFLLIEKIGVVASVIWVTFFISSIYFMTNYHLGGSVPLEFNLILAFIALFAFVFIVTLFVIPAYFRGKFLRKGGYCVIAPDHIESVCGDKKKCYVYKNKSIKTKKHKDGSTDIFIGKSFIDVLKHGSFIFTPKFLRAWKDLIGFGAPLYRVTNADEVLEYLEKHK